MFKLEDLSAMCQVMALASGHRSMVSDSFEIEGVLPPVFFQSLVDDLNKLQTSVLIGKERTQPPLELMQFLDIQFPFNVRVHIDKGKDEFILRPRSKMAKVVNMPSLLKPTGGVRA